MQDGLARELAEEIGLEVPADPPHLWHQATVAEAENVHGHRWWTLAELQSHQGPDFLSPRSLPHLLARLLAEGPPQQPVFQGL